MSLARQTAENKSISFCVGYKAKSKVGSGIQSSCPWSKGNCTRRKRAKPTTFFIYTRQQPSPCRVRHLRVALTHPDRSVEIFLNIHGTVGDESPALLSMFDYMATGRVHSDFAAALDAEVRKIKTDAVCRGMTDGAARGVGRMSTAVDPAFLRQLSNKWGHFIPHKANGKPTYTRYRIRGSAKFFRRYLFSSAVVIVSLVHFLTFGPATPIK